MPVKTDNSTNSATTNFAAQVTSASTTFVSSGVGIAFTPSSTGKILVTAAGPCGNTTTADGVKVAIFRTTGAIPANNVATTGTQLTTVFIYTALTGVLMSTFTTVDIDSPTIGTAVNYYIGYAAVTGGTASIGSASAIGTITALEI